MASEKQYLALDLGAESGRCMSGVLLNGKLELTEVHRFPTGPISLPTAYPAINNDEVSQVWDFLRFWQEAKTSIQAAAKLGKITSMGVDTWGVDFALLDKNGGLISHPYHYRDSRTNGMMEKAFERLSRKRIYEITGIQFMQLNTLYQLLSMQLQGSPALEIADKLLMVPDLINYWLTGQAVAEFSDVTTTQMYDANLGDWSPEIIAAMGFPQHIFPEIVPPGTRIGKLRPSLVKELGSDFEVVTSVSHDTGSAVAAVPAEAEDFIWISSGTWSIIGMNTQAPVINTLSYKHNLTNEGGRAKSNRFSKNVMGLWLVQQCRQAWKKEGKDYSYTELTDFARSAPHLKTIIDPDYHEFLQMGGMIDKIHRYCKITGQPVPETEGETIRAVLQGLALRYRTVIEQLEAISGKKTTAIHIVGGGTKNELLSQFTADALRRKVITGPVEATAIGNIIVQAQSMGGIANYQEGLVVIRNSFDIKTFLPGDSSGWDQAYALLKENEKKVKLAF